MDTRSLSITSLGNGTVTNSSTDTALLFYENPTGNASVLVQRITTQSSQAQWVDITSQTSQSLPGEFRNADPIVEPSHTLYESDIVATFSTPFTIIGLDEDETGDGYPSEIEALFCSPPDATRVSTIYSPTIGAPGKFSTSKYLKTNHCS